MSICLPDSGILIDVLNGRRGRAEMVTQLIREGSELACCSINVTEVYAGLRPGEEDKTERLLRSLRFYEITWEIAKLAGSGGSQTGSGDE
jgi:predicted nucleic acid-binding protein